MKVLKRNGTYETVNPKKIKNAVKAAFKSLDYIVDEEVYDEIVENVKLWDEISIEDIQDEVIETLRDFGYDEVADAYLIYKHKHNETRKLVQRKKEFINRYKESNNTANATIDDNSNVGGKNIGILNAEAHKEENILVSRGMITDKLKELFPDFNSKNYIHDLNNHIIYKHDESTFMGPIAPYCCSISMYPFLLNGIKDLGGLSASPKNLDSFCGMYINLIFAIAGQFAGAVATSEFLIYFDYFARRVFGEDYTNCTEDFYAIGPELRKLIKTTDVPFKYFFSISNLAKYDFKSEELNKLRDKVVNDATRQMTKEELKEWYNNCTGGGIGTGVSGGFTYQPYKIGDGSRTIVSQIRQYFQQVVYSINQPSAARGMQAAFVNFSYFDKPFFDAMFENFYFPDNTKPTWESVKWIQKEFMQWFNAERLKCLITFPVESVALIYKDGKFEDEEMADFVAEEYAKGHSFFTYISDTADSLSSCCRLKNKVNTKEFNFTNGNMGVETGSKSVITLNLSRIIQDWYRQYNPKCNRTEKTAERKMIAVRRLWETESKELLKEYITNILNRVYKYHIAYNECLWDMYDAGLLPVYKAGFISLDKQYLTIGINGLNQAAEFLGINCSDNEEYKEFCQFIFSTIKGSNNEANGTYFNHKVTFNTECVPAESLAVKNYNWDKADGYWIPEDTNLYASYIFKPNDPNISILQKIILHGKDYIGDYLDGGSAAHINLSEHLSKEQYKKILKFAAKNGCQYFTFNVPNCECENCGFIAKFPFDKCPLCGSTKVSLWDRIIGYLTKIKNWSEGRQIEQKTRVYESVHSKGLEGISHI